MSRPFASGEYRVKTKNVFTWHLVVYKGLVQSLFYLNLPAMPRGSCYWLHYANDGSFPWDSTGKESTCNAEDVGDAVSVPGSGRSSGGRNGNLFQYSCLKNPHGLSCLSGYSSWVTKCWTWLSNYAYIHTNEGRRSEHLRVDLVGWPISKGLQGQLRKAPTHPEPFYYKEATQTRLLGSWECLSRIESLQFNGHEFE